LFYLLMANIMLVVFNLIPAFPMDGGRILRALLTMKMDRVRATQIAALLGQTLAFLFFLVGLLYNPFLILIALFVYFGAQGENMMVQQLTLLQNHRVREAMMTNITVLKPDDFLDQVVDVILSGTERDFVVTEDENVAGVIYQSDLMQTLKQRNGHVKVKEVMSTDFENVQAGDDLTYVYRKVQARKKSFFPVVENGRLVGAIDMNNINEFIVFRAALDF
jgi:CBS domain-containing protein